MTGGAITPSIFTAVRGSDGAAMERNPTEDKMKVWGGILVNHKRSRENSGMVRTIVAARSQKEAAKVIGMTLYGFRGYWSETGNAHEIASATARPRVVLQATTSMGSDFEPR